MVKEQQYKDSEVRKIIEDLVRDDTQRHDFELHGGVLYRKPINDTDWLKLYIPKTLIKEVLKLTHSHKLAGHPGVQKTKQIIRKNFFTPQYS